MITRELYIASRQTSNDQASERTEKILTSASALEGERKQVTVHFVDISAAEVFRSLGSPRKRAGDIAIGVTAAATGAALLTRNAKDFAGVPDLRLEPVGS